MRAMLCLALVFIVSTVHLNAQCSFPAGTPNGSCTGTTLVNNTTISTGSTYAYSGAATTFGSINLSGGTLQICGTLTITNLNINGGTIVIMSGGSLTLSNVSLNTAPPAVSITNYGTLTLNGTTNISGGNSLINYGTLNCNGQVTVQGAGAILVNGSTTASINMGSNNLVLNAPLVNLGSITASGLTINTGGSICAGPGSTINTATLSNNVTNSLTVSPSGSATCLRFTGAAVDNSKLTSSSGVNICQGPGATSSGAGGFGSATVTTNCTGCNTILPLTLVDFSATLQSQDCDLEWTTAMEENMAGFGVEVSMDGSHFEQAGFVQAADKPFTYNFTYNMSQNTWFRLRMQDLDGAFIYSRVLYVGFNAPTGEKIWVTPNPGYGGQATLHLLSGDVRDGQLIVAGLSGQTVLKMPLHLVKGQNDMILPVESLPSGTYMIVYICGHGKIGPVKWIKLGL